MSNPSLVMNAVREFVARYPVIRKPRGESGPVEVDPHDLIKLKDALKQADSYNPVYAKRLNGAQRKMLHNYYNLSGFEPMYQDDLDAGDITFAELWNKNVTWLEDVAIDVGHIREDGSGL